MPSNSIKITGYNARGDCGYTYSSSSFTYSYATATLLCENPSSISEIMFSVELMIPGVGEFVNYGINETLQAILDVEVTEGVTEEEPVDDTPLYMSNYQLLMLT